MVQADAVGPAAVLEAAERLSARLVSSGASAHAYEVAARQIEKLPAVVDTGQRWQELIGPFYDTSGLQGWLGVSRQRLSQLIKRGDLLAVRTTGGRLYYPAWQFQAEGRVIPGVSAVLRGLGDRSGYNKALWLTAPREEFGGHRTIDVLANADPADVRDIIREAQADGERWRH